MKINEVKNMLVDLFPIEILKNDISILLLDIKEQSGGQMAYSYYIVDKKNNLPYNGTNDFVKDTLDDFIVNFFIKESNS